ncbi:hypothetical protein POTOM_050183 [Populus tomentosa]|uniref:Uncharacterized protein n=1 Tax=Populus tomentosa TaxID=118781 RepID=A0A8X7YBB0_POPTO|nr:hypothetical protein POTOM_050183 [Populus tomentosa]
MATMSGSTSAGDTITELPGDVMKNTAGGCDENLYSTALAATTMAFKPPSAFEEFDVSLEFRKVLFAAERFGIFISNCPLLERTTLEGCPRFFCLGICLLISSISPFAETAKYFRDGKTSNLVENLNAEQHFLKIEEISCALCLIRSSPDLQKLTIRVSGNSTSALLLCLLHLKTVKSLCCVPLLGKDQGKCCHGTCSGIYESSKLLRLLIETYPWCAAGIGIHKVLPG